MVRIPIKEDEIPKAYEAIKNGGLAIIPSRVGYTLLGNGEDAITKMYKLKGRPLTKPCIIITRYDILLQIAEIPEKYTHLIQVINHSKILCGFILKRKNHDVFNSLAQYTNTNAMKSDGTSCFVINSGEYTQYLVDHSWEDHTVVVGSSSNKSGTGNEGVFANIPADIRDHVEYALEHDDFVHQEYDPITRQQGVMVDLTGDEPVMIRKGLKVQELEAIIMAFTRKDKIPFKDHNTGREEFISL